MTPTREKEGIIEECCIRLFDDHKIVFLESPEDTLPIDLATEI